MYADEIGYSYEGLRPCHDCGKSKADGASRCRPCADAHARRVQIQRMERVRLGQCALCGLRGPKSTSRWRCVQCSDDLARNSARRYKARRALDLCVDCGRPADGRAYCMVCTRRRAS